MAILLNICSLWYWAKTSFNPFLHYSKEGPTWSISYRWFWAQIVFFGFPFCVTESNSSLREMDRICPTSGRWVGILIIGASHTLMSFSLAFWTNFQRLTTSQRSKEQYLKLLIVFLSLFISYFSYKNSFAIWDLAAFPINNNLKAHHTCSLNTHASVRQALVNISFSCCSNQNQNPNNDVHTIIKTSQSVYLQQHHKNLSFVLYKSWWVWFQRLFFLVDLNS